MSYTTRKKKGFRQITVEGKRYRWVLRLEGEDSTVTLQGMESGGQQANVALPDVCDPWLHCGSDDKVPWDVITPRFIREVVQEALARGWGPEERTGPLEFTMDYWAWERRQRTAAVARRT